MPFIPNAADAFHESQASPDSQHFESLRAGSKATGVVSGCAVTAQGTPDMTVAVAAGVVAVEGVKANVTAGNLTLTADGTNPRFYLIVASSAGVKSAVAGTPVPEMDPPTEPGPVFPDPAGGVVLASVYVPAADTDIDANQIDDMRVFVIPPEPTTNYDLAKARDIPLVKERSQTVALDSGQNLVHASALANGKLFLSGQTSPAWFVRCNNLEDLADRSSFNFAADGFHNSGQAMVPEGEKVYVLFSNTDRIFVSSVDQATLAVVDIINDTSRIAGTNGSICSDGTHLYVATLTTPAKVVKYTLAGAFVSEVSLTKNSAHAILYDQASLFLTGSTSPGWIARVDPAAMTVSQEVDFATGMNIATDDLASVGDHVWVGVEITNNINVLRIEKAALTNQVKVAFGTAAVWAVHHGGDYVWTAAGSIYRIDPVTLDEVEYTAPSASPNEILSNGTGRLFVTTYTSPSNVSRFYPSIPVTKRIGMPNLTVGGSIDTVLPMGKRFIDSATRTTSGTSEATLGQMSVAGNLLNVDGMMLRVTVAGSFAANANTKRIAIRLSASNYMFDTGLLPFNDARWKFMLEIIRTGAATQDWTAFFISDSSVLPTDVQFGTTTADLATLLFMAVRAQTPTAAGDATQEHYMVEVIS